VTGDRRALVAGAAMVIAAGSASYVFAQTAGPPAGTPTTTTTGAQQGNGPPGADQSSLNIQTGAQSSFARDRNVSVTQRPHEGYEAKGLRMGAFLAYPKLSVTPEYDDNIYATETNTQSDTVWHVTPEVNLASDWSRNAVGAYAHAILNRYQKRSEENTTDWGAGVNGRIDLLRFSNITANVDWARLTEPRTSPNSPGVAAKPVRYDLWSAGVDIQHEINRLRLGGHYGYQNFSYESPPKIGGGVVAQDYRDRTSHTLSGRLDYAVSPDTAVFFELDGNKRDYRHRITTDVNRDSKGVQGLVGVNFELSALVRGELAGGYLRQTFSDSRLRTVKAFGARGKVEWFPTQLTTVTLNAGRTVEDSAVPAEGAYLSNNLGAQVDHELLRNVILTARAGYGVDRYKDINRTDHRTSAGLSGTYLLNRTLGLSGAYSYDKTKTVRGTGNNFTDNKVSVTLTAQF